MNFKMLVKKHTKVRSSTPRMKINVTEEDGKMDLKKSYWVF